jgi:hypothetical protein
VRFVVPPREERGMDARMQRFHATAEQDRRAGLLLDGFRVHAFHRERGTRAIGRDEIPSKLAQTARERDETGRIRS